jgi:Mn2+/Fe2+ NRAMP family transporter
MLLTVYCCCRAAAAFFYGKEQQVIALLSDAYNLLTPAVGTVAAKILFGVALLASGQNSTITGTLAGIVSFPDLCLWCLSSSEDIDNIDK